MNYLFRIVCMLLPLLLMGNEPSVRGQQDTKQTEPIQKPEPTPKKKHGGPLGTPGIKSQKMTGWISDEKCGAKDIDNADCAKKCAENGSKLVFVSEKDKSIINVDNQDALKGHEGHHVKVTGTLDNGTLHIDKVAMLKQSGQSHN
jgi:hypothetical protein